MFWNLKNEMRKAHITTAQLAAAVGIGSSAMSKKLNGHNEFLYKEVKKIAAIFPDKGLDYLFDEGVEA